uniref:Uncharacterized protein LOC105054917 n=1 Tax=Elaeis guineensis var. tenera TaxID=51953 RepID=A0A6I9RYX8_ELAGV|nr:uncharacterized protein LOC105054917 [Elaeis guineensis]
MQLAAKKKRGGSGGSCSGFKGGGGGPNSGSGEGDDEGGGVSVRRLGLRSLQSPKDGAATTDHAAPSTAPSASAASKRTTTLLPTNDEFMSLFAAAVIGAISSLRSVKKEDPAGLEVMIGALFGLRLDDMESILDCLLGLAEEMKGDQALKIAMEALGNVEMLKSTVRGATMLLAEKRKRDGSGGSCSGSKGGGKGPDSGSGEGDGEGGGVSV